MNISKSWGKKIRRWIKPRSESLKFLALITGIFCLVLAISAPAFFSKSWIIFNAVRVTGTVESVFLDEIQSHRPWGQGGGRRSDRHHPHAVYSAVVVFQDENGEIHRFKTSAGAYPAHLGEALPEESYPFAQYSPGDQVPVVFSSSSPDWALVDKPSRLPRGSGVALFLAWLALVWGPLVFVAKGRDPGSYYRTYPPHLKDVADTCSPSSLQPMRASQLTVRAARGDWSFHNAACVVLGVASRECLKKLRQLSDYEIEQNYGSAFLSFLHSGRNLEDGEVLVSFLEVSPPRAFVLVSIKHLVSSNGQVLSWVYADAFRSGIEVARDHGLPSVCLVHPLSYRAGYSACANMFPEGGELIVEAALATGYKGDVVLCVPDPPPSTTRRILRIQKFSAVGWKAGVALGLTMISQIFPDLTLLPTPLPALGLVGLGLLVISFYLFFMARWENPESVQKMLVEELQKRIDAAMHAKTK